MSGSWRGGISSGGICMIGEKGGVGGVMNWEYGINRCTLPYRKQVNSKDLLYSTGNSIQYPGINHNGKEYKKECVYIYVQLNHFAVHLKLTQHCKPTILQFKKRCRVKTTLEQSMFHVPAGWAFPLDTFVWISFVAESAHRGGSWRPGLRAGALATTGYIIFWSRLLGPWNVTFWPLVEAGQCDRASDALLMIPNGWDQPDMCPVIF